jgi:hypothetical protein
LSKGCPYKVWIEGDKADDDPKEGKVGKVIDFGKFSKGDGKIS